MSKPKHCGFVSILGRPNVGKSTLMNRILGKKLSIMTRKPQTTRQRVSGIKTLDAYQTVYVDTPGLHLKAEKALNRYMNREALAAIEGVDVIVFVVAGTQWTADDALVLDALQRVKCPVILAINKIDLVRDKAELLPHIEMLNQKYAFVTTVPLSAKTGKQIDELENVIHQHLPEQDFFFPEGQFTDRDDQFLASELIREKLIRALGKELPYALAIMIEKFEKVERPDREPILHVSAVIYVERPGQKAIVIGKEGERLKQLGQKARLDMEKLFGSRVFLKLWVKVKKSWSDDAKILHQLGLD